MRNKVLVVALALSSLFCVGFVYRQARPTWEYKTIPILLSDPSLDKLGSEGWELVTVDGSRGTPVYYFKRPK